MDTVKVYEKNPAGAAGGTNDIEVDGEKWFLSYQSQDDRLDFWVLSQNNDVIVEKGGERFRVTAKAV